MSNTAAQKRELSDFSQQSFVRHLASGTGGNLSRREVER
jgi:hypothetical protein